MSDSETTCTVAYQAPLYMGFSRQEPWIGLPFPPPSLKYNLPNTYGQAVPGGSACLDIRGLQTNCLYVIFSGDKPSSPETVSLRPWWERAQINEIPTKSSTNYSKIIQKAFMCDAKI